MWEDEKMEDLEETLAYTEFEDGVWQIAVDIGESDTQIIILAPIAGVVLHDIDVDFDAGVLTISWNRKKPEFFSSDMILRRSECFWGKFVRNIILPDNLDIDSIKAIMDNNLLIITLNKFHISSQNIKINRVES